MPKIKLEQDNDSGGHVGAYSNLHAMSVDDTPNVNLEPGAEGAGHVPEHGDPTKQQQAPVTIQREPVLAKIEADTHSLDSAQLGPEIEQSQKEPIHAKAEVATRSPGSTPSAQEINQSTEELVHTKVEGVTHSLAATPPGLEINQPEQERSFGSLDILPKRKITWDQESSPVQDQQKRQKQQTSGPEKQTAAYFEAELLRIEKEVDHWDNERKAAEKGLKKAFRNLTLKRKQKDLLLKAWNVFASPEGIVTHTTGKDIIKRLRAKKSTSQLQEGILIKSEKDTARSMRENVAGRKIKKEVEDDASEGSDSTSEVDDEDYQEIQRVIRQAESSAMVDKLIKK